MKHLPRLLWTAMAGFLIFYSSVSRADCARLELAQRTGLESCWAKFNLGNRRTLCVSHRNWVQWLRSPTPPRICGDSSQPWKAYSPLINEPHSPGTDDK